MFHIFQIRINTHHKFTKLYKNGRKTMYCTIFKTPQMERDDFLSLYNTERASTTSKEPPWLLGYPLRRQQKPLQLLRNPQWLQGEPPWFTVRHHNFRVSLQSPPEGALTTLGWTFMTPKWAYGSVNLYYSRVSLYGYRLIICNSKDCILWQQSDSV